MSEEPKSYLVETIEDMAKIPPDRLPSFLAELPEMIAFVRESAAAIASVRAELIAQGICPEAIALGRGGMRWIDDGERNRTVNLTMTLTERGS